MFRIVPIILSSPCGSRTSNRSLDEGCLSCELPRDKGDLLAVKAKDLMTILRDTIHSVKWFIKEKRDFVLQASEP